MGEHRGVSWSQRHQRWTAVIFKDGKSHYLGEYEDQGLAIAIRLEAETLPVSEFPALKEKYRAKRDGQLAEPTAAPQPEAAIEPPAPAQPVDHAVELNTRLLLARAAEARYQVTLETLAEAQWDACEAEQAAVAAWNDYAKVLAALGLTAAFDKSVLGFIREEIARHGH